MHWEATLWHRGQVRCCSSKALRKWNAWHLAKSIGGFNPIARIGHQRFSSGYPILFGAQGAGFNDSLPSRRVDILQDHDSVTDSVPWFFSGWGVQGSFHLQNIGGCLKIGHPSLFGLVSLVSFYVIFDYFCYTIFSWFSFPFFPFGGHGNFDPTIERFNLAARFLDISFSGPETNGYVD